MTILRPDLTGKVIEREGCSYTGDGEKPDRYRFVNGPKNTYSPGGFKVSREEM